MFLACQADEVGSPEFSVGNEGKLNYFDEARFEINKVFHIFISSHNESLQKFSKFNPEILTSEMLTKVLFLCQYFTSYQSTFQSRIY